MGGLRKKIPVTFATLICAGVAIAGIPPFAGFYSKDAILIAAYEHTPWMFYVGVITAGMTAFYVFRAIFLTFFGEYKGAAHPHESPTTMTFPLIALAILSVIGGYVFNVPRYLEGMFRKPEEGNTAFLMAISVGVAGLGIVIAGHLYLGRNNMAEQLAKNFHGLYSLIYNKFFVDEIYDAAVVQPVVGVSRVVLWKGIDTGLINGLVDGVAKQVRNIGSLLRRLQSGSVRSYATWVVFGSLMLLVAMTLAGVTR